jgi:hypothetical protein
MALRDRNVRVLAQGKCDEFIEASNGMMVMMMIRRLRHALQQQ